MPTDLEIAQSARLKPVVEVASQLGIHEDELDLYGKYKAKIKLSVLDRLKDKPNGKYVDVTAITPTPLGEGKTVTTVGLSMDLNRIGKTSLCAIRQPSMGPTFGIKGGAAGGGYSQVVPMEEFNLHFTGDIHAVGAAHNLLAAFIDNSIHHGNSSIIADQIGLKLVDYVVTESGFGVDIGAEKCFNLKCRWMNIKPCVAVLVCTVRALKMHSGRFQVIAGKPLGPEIMEPNPKAVEEGCSNLIKQIENVRLHGVTVIVAINRFDTDHAEEIDVIRKAAEGAGAEKTVESFLWAKGGEGGEELARAVVETMDQPCGFHYLYELDWSIEKKIETVATKIYGAKGVEYSLKARKQIKKYTELGWDNLPICIAKTHLSLSHDPKLKGRPKDFTVHVRDIRASIGAGFLYPLLGTMTTMPGLPSHPAGERIDIDENGNVVGLS